MIDTGGTITKAADAVRPGGRRSHRPRNARCVLSDPATERIKNSRITEVVVTDTLPIPSERRSDKLTILSIAPLIAKAINEVFTDGSVTSLFGSAHG